jgi:hypothetical protein
VILEARADHRSLDPVDRFVSAYPLVHTPSGPSVGTTIRPAPTAFTS